MWHTDKVDPSEYPDQKSAGNWAWQFHGGQGARAESISFLDTKARKEEEPCPFDWLWDTPYPKVLILCWSHSVAGKIEGLGFSLRLGEESWYQSSVTRWTQCSPAVHMGVSFRETLTVTKKSWIDWQTHLKQKQRPQRIWAPWSWAVREKQDEETRNPGARQATRQWHYHLWELLGTSYSISRQVKLCT